MTICSTFSTSEKKTDTQSHDLYTHVLFLLICRLRAPDVLLHLLKAISSCCSVTSTQSSGPSLCSTTERTSAWTSHINDVNCLSNGVLGDTVLRSELVVCKITVIYAVLIPVYLLKLYYNSAAEDLPW
jgi:hypothetical protein